VQRSISLNLEADNILSDILSSINEKVLDNVTSSPHFRFIALQTSERSTMKKLVQEISIRSKQMKQALWNYQVRAECARSRFKEVVKHGINNQAYFTRFKLSTRF